MPIKKIDLSLLADVTQKQRLVLVGGNISQAGNLGWIDVTGASITMVTSANPVLILVQGIWYSAPGVSNLVMDIAIDGVRQGGSQGIQWQSPVVAGNNYLLNINWPTGSLSAASHVFKLQWTSDGSVTIYASGSVGLLFAVYEFKL